MKKLTEFVKKYKIEYPVVLASREFVEYFGEVSSIPTSFIIDRNGKIRSRIIGYRDYNEIESAILRLIQEKKKEEIQI